MQPATPSHGVNTVVSAAVTVSVVSHGHGDDVLYLLSDLAAWGRHDVHEVIVTCNLPEPSLSDMLQTQSWPFRVTLLNNPQPLGYGSNHNQAFQHCATPYFAVLNPDIRFKANPFPALCRALQPHQAGCAYPWAVQHWSDTPTDHARELLTPSSLWRRYMRLARAPLPTSNIWVNGAFMLFKSSVYQRLNGFDPAYFMYCEDVDICLRLATTGLQLVSVPSVVIQHHASRASQKNWRHFVWHVQSLGKLWRSAAYKAVKNGY